MKVTSLITILMLIFFMAGCQTLKEAARGFAGVSTKILEDSRGTALKKTVNLGQDACYDKVEKMLKEGGSSIYAGPKDRSMIAIYVSDEDTTPVGIFFTKIDADKTQIEVSSPSSPAKEFIAQKLFSLE